MASVSKEPLHIVFVANQPYVVGLAAAVQSVLTALKSYKQAATVWVLDFGLSPEAQHDLRLLVNQLSWSKLQLDYSEIPMNEEADCHLVQLRVVSSTANSAKSSLLPPAMGYVSSITWAKLFLPALLPFEAQDNDGQILYLDSDTLIFPGTDVSELLEVDLQVKHDSSRAPCAAMCLFKVLTVQHMAI
jgi:lipopolysaccharide biosynthesis glycosyltransferase